MSARLLAIYLLLGSLSSFGQDEFDCDTVNVPLNFQICEGAETSVDWLGNWVPNFLGPQSFELESPDGADVISLNQNQSWDFDDQDAGVWTWSTDLPGQGDANVCTGTIEIIVNPSPVSGFTFTGQGQCSNSAFAFANASTGQAPLSYSWSFGAGGSLGNSSQANPTTDLSTIGSGGVSIPVTLTVVDGNDCSATITQSVSALGIPEVGLPDNLSALCVNSAIEDYNFQPIWPANNSGSTVSFDWGDGSAADVYNSGEYFGSLTIGHLYSSFGFFDLTMTVEGSNGCSNSEVGEVFVGANPQVGAANPGGTTGICGPEELVFILDNVDGNDPTTIYIIDWGDNSPLDTLSHPPPSELSHLYDQSSCGFSVESGSTTIGNSFYFSVVAQNLCDQSTALITPVRINTAPDVEFTVPYEWCVNEEIVPSNMTTPGEVANANECVDNNIYQWLIGPEGAACFDVDNPISCCLLPEFSNNCAGTFDFVAASNTPGEYQIELTGSNSCDTDSMVQSICVVPYPEPAFTLEPTVACAPFEVTPDNLSNTLESCGATDYYWIITDLSKDKKANYGTDYLYINETDSFNVEPDLEFLTPGCYSVELRAENRCGPVTTEPVEITVLSPPIAMLSGSNELCEGGQLTFTGTGSAGNEELVDYQWYLDGVPNPDGQFVFPTCSGDDMQSNEQVFEFSEDGTYDVLFEVENSCGVQSEATQVTVYPLPEVSVLPLALEACEGDSVFFESSGATSYVWDFDANPLSANGDNASGSIFSNLTGTVTGSVGYGALQCSASATFSATVLELPNPTISIPPFACDEDEVVAGAQVSGGQPAYDFDWSGPYGSGAGSSLTLAADVDFSGSIELLVTDGNGCQGSTNAELSVLPLPLVVAGPDLTLCDQPIVEQLDGFSPEGGTWNGAGIVNASTGTFDPSAVGVGITELTYSYVDNNGCENSDVTEVSVVVPETAEAGPNVVICDVDTSLAFLDFTPTTAGVWSGPGVTDGATGVVNAAPLSPGSYTYTYSYGTGTCLSEDTRQLTVLERPELDLTAADLTVCTGETASFMASVSGGQEPYVFSWGPNLTPGTTTSTTTSATAVMDLETDPFVVTLLVTDANGCSDEVTFTIDVLELPVVDAGLDTVFCDQPIAGTLLGFSPGLNELGTGYWTGLGGASGALDASGNYDPNISGLGTFEAVYTYTADATGCTHTDTIEVTVTEPVVAYAGLDTTVCDNAYPLQLEGYFPTSGVNWSGMTPASAAALLDAETGLISPVILTPGSYDYLLEFGYGTCYTRDTVTVNVDALPVITLASDDVFCVNDGEPLLTTFSPTGGTWVGLGVVDDAAGVFAVDGAETGVGNYDLLYWYQDSLTGCRDTAFHEVLVQDIPVVDAGLDTVFCDQPIAGTLLGFSPGLNELGTGYWTGLGGAAGALTPEGDYNPDLSGLGTFEAVYTYTADATGCTHTDTIEVTVTEPVVAYAGLDTTVCDNAYPLQLEGYFPTSGVNWSGMTPASAAALLDAETGLISPGILTPGSYDYLLEFGYGTCYTRDTVTVNVDPLPAITSGPEDAFCANLGIVSMTPMDPLGGTWYGPGVVDPQAGTFQTAQIPGEYPVNYWYEDSLTGCRDTADHVVEVLVVPVSAFEVDTLGCVNLDLPLANNSTGAMEYLWDFGTDSTSTAFEPGYTYPADGVYDLILYVTNALGCKDTSAAMVEITHPPTADFLLTPDSGCAPLEVEFSNFSDGPYADFLWTVNGEEFAQVEPPALNFQQGDSIVDYVVLLEVENLCGEDDLVDSIKVFPSPQMDFVLSEDTVCSPYEMFIVNTSVGLPDDVLWDFGDGTEYTGPNPPPHFYSVDSLPELFDITVIGTNECGTDDTTFSVWVKPNTVQAFFTLSSAEGCVPYTLEVTDFSVATTDVAFDFDNGSFANDSISTTVYIEAGTYDVTQLVTNGCSFDTLVTQVLVNPAPQIDLSVDIPELCEEDFFFFEAEVEDPGDVNWDFGDGFQYDGLITSHAYDSAGEYWVSLYAEAALTGCPNTDSLMVTVNANPVIDLEILPESGCHPLEVTFVNSTTGSSFQTWVFSDGSESTSVYAPVHTFENPSLDPEVFFVFLTAESEAFCSSNAMWEITVLPTPQAEFTLAEETSCSYPIPVSVTNQSIGSISHQWVFDGLPFSGFEPLDWQAEGVGVYPVELTATNSYGCTDMAEAEFEVFLPPIAALDAAPYSGCNPLTVSFTDASFNSVETYLSIEGVYDGPLPSNLVLDEVGAYAGEVSVISADGCADTLSLLEQFEVYPIPEGGLAEPVCALNIPPGSNWCTEYRFSDTTQAGVQYQWYFSDGYSTITTAPDLVHDFGVDELDHSVLVILQNEFGCPDTLFREFEVISELEVFVPNAFMPTADWPNNTFVPVFNAPGRVENYEFVIFNRWGSEVYRSDVLGEPWIGDGAMPWNNPGTHYAKDDVYNWILRYRDRLTGAGGVQEHRGMVVLLR